MNRLVERLITDVGDPYRQRKGVVRADPLIVV
jgi:hypothetical protein